MSGRVLTSVGGEGAESLLTLRCGKNERLLADIDWLDGKLSILLEIEPVHDGR